MNIENLEDFNKLVDSCKKRGVKTVKFGEFFVEIDLSLPAPISAYKQNKQKDISQKLSREDLEKALFWSSGGIPVDEVVNG